MIEQLVMKDMVCWRGPAKELLPYLKRLGQEHQTVRDLIKQQLN